MSKKPDDFCVCDSRIVFLLYGYQMIEAGEGVHSVHQSGFSFIKKIGYAFTSAAWMQILKTLLS